MTDTTPFATPPDQPQLTLRLATHPKRVGHTDYLVQLGPDATIANVKQVVGKWDGQPKAEGVLVIVGGRILTDDEKVVEVLPGGSGVLHVMVKASAWTMPFAEELQPVSPPPPATTSASAPPATPAPVPPLHPTHLNLPPPNPPQITTTLPTPHPPSSSSDPLAARLESLLRPSPGPDSFTSSSATATARLPDGATNLTAHADAGAYATYLGLLAQLEPVQRALLLLSLQKAHYAYAKEVRRRLVALEWAEEMPDEGKEKEEGNKDDQVAEVRDEEGEVAEVRNLLVDCGLWGLVEEQLTKADNELATWHQTHNQHQQDQQPGDQFQLVQLSNLPFLLHLPEPFAAPSPPPPRDLYLSLKRARAISSVLQTMLQLLVTFQPSAAAIAHGRTLQRHPAAVLPPASPLARLDANQLPVPPVLPLPGEARAAAVAALNAGGARGARAAGAAGVGGERGVRLAIVIDLEAVGAIVLPLFLLALKLTFLLWIFGRNASTRKRYILAGMAGVWIVWEGWRLLRLRAGVRREAELRAQLARVRERRERREAEMGPEGRAEWDELRQQARAELRRRAGRDELGRVREQAQAGAEVGAGVGGAGGEGGEPAARALAPGPEPNPNLERIRARAARRARTPTSRLTPKYWVNWVAAFGLADEAREMGLVPRSIAGRPVPRGQGAGAGARNGGADAPGAGRRRAWRTLLTACVLFVGTLIPEVERKRKKALEKRDKLVAERAAIKRNREVAQARAAEAAAAAQSAGPAGDGSVVGGAEGNAGAGAVTGGGGGGWLGGQEGAAGAVGGELATPRLASPRPPPLNRAGTTIRPPPSAEGSSSSFQAHASDVSLQRRDGSASVPGGSGAALPPAGRTVVSDAELFADGLGEADQDREHAGEGERAGARSPLLGTDDERAAVGEGESTDDEEEGRRGGEEAREDEVDEIVALF